MRNPLLPLPTIKMLYDISHMLPRAKRFSEKEGRYNLTLKKLLDLNFFEDEDYPSIKKISEDLNMDMRQLRKHIKKIYEMLLFGEKNNHENIPVFKFNKPTYIFRAHGPLKTFYDFQLEIIENLPRIGEAVTLPFIKTYLGGIDIFYVDNIYHTFENQHHEIWIELRPGGYNKYWQFRLDEAEAKNEITINERLEMCEGDLKRKLKIWR